MEIDTIDIHEDIDEIKKEYLEYTSPLIRVNSHDQNIIAKRLLLDLTNLRKSSYYLNNNSSILGQQKNPSFDDFEAPEDKENSSGEKEKVSQAFSSEEKDLAVNLKSVPQAGDGSFEHGEYAFKLKSVVDGDPAILTWSIRLGLCICK